MPLPAGVRLLAATIALIPALGVGAQQPDSVVARRAFTVANVRVREAPDVRGRVIVILPRGPLVTVGDCDDNWCAIAFRSIDGFTARRYLAFSNRVLGDDSAVAQQAAPVPSGRGYINSQGRWVPSPTRTPDGKPPAGASAQCRDGPY